MRAAEDAATNAGMDLSALKANAYHAAAGEAETLSADVVVEMCIRDRRRIKKDSFAWYKKVIATQGADLA